jgi:phage FluMu gp28-like protein
MKTGTYTLNHKLYKEAEELADAVLRETNKPETFYKEYGCSPEKSVEAFERTKRLMALNVLRHQIKEDERDSNRL